MRTIHMERKRTFTALAASLAAVALVVTAPSSRADDVTGTPTPPATSTSDTSAAGDTGATATESASTAASGSETTSATTSASPTETTSATTSGTTSTQTGAEAASPVVLRRGDTGLKVKDLQSRLAAVGRTTGTIDGVYDAEVETAVAAYLGFNGLPGDGSEVTEEAWALLVDQTATPIVIPAGTTSLRVKDLQVRLRIVNAAYWTYSISGVYGWTLGQRVLAFQQDQGLPQSGVVDQRTWDRLRAMTATRTLLKEGASGNMVKDLQVRLRIVKASYWTYAISGYYGWTLGQRVLAFQQDHNLPQSGVLDQRTWDRLRAVTATPVVLSTSAPVNNVKELQLRLRARGYWSYSISGVYGWTLGQKVLAFQRGNDLPQSGVVDKRTWARLVSLTYTPGTFDAYRFAAGLRPHLPTAASLDQRCRTGRALCISKRTRTVTWIVDGKPIAVMWARFGMPGYETREGTFSVLRKYEYVISNLYFVPMPYSMFFSGGQAVHYSSNFARLGYSTGSHGCVNVKDMETLKKVYFQVKVGDKVIVYR